MINANKLLSGVKKPSYLGILVVTLSFFLLSILAPSAFALTADQKSLFDNGIFYFDSSGTQSTSCAYSSDNTSGGGSHTPDQIKTFESVPITATWNISDGTVEQWFLNQSSMKSRIAKYGLNSSNIGAITSTVKAAGVSPVFFYLWAVNEVWGAGGFINEYASDVPGGGVPNAKRDAEYIASHSKIMNSTPSWYDAGNPVHFVPQNVQDAGNADFQKIPSGTIGRVYIPASAAATWEVYYPNGLKKEYNQVENYGAPFEEAMQNISSMGGNPLQGGSTISSDGCTGGSVAGQGITKAINWAVMIAKNDGYGYDQIRDSNQTLPGPARVTGWAKWQSDPNCTHQCGSFDCSSFVAAALTVGGYFKTNPEFATTGEAADLSSAGFKKVASYPTSSANLQPGDILLNTQKHTAMYIGNNQVVQASQNENNQIDDGLVGDQTGQEINISPFYVYPYGGWDSVYRASN